MYSYSGKLGGSAAIFEEDFVLVFTNAREFLKFSTYNSNTKVALIWQYFIVWLRKAGVQSSIKRIVG